MFSKKTLFLICFLLFLCLPSFLFADLVGDAGLTLNTGPTGVCNASDYTWYETLDLSSGVISGYWSPSQPGNVSVGFEATATGYGYIEASLSYTVGSVSGSLNLRAEAGYYGVAFFVPFTVPAINGSVGATGDIGSIGSHFGRYDWDVKGTAYVQAVYWNPEAGFPVQGGEFDPYGKPDDKDVTGSGSFEVSSKKVCPKCGSTSISYFSEHKYMSCPASITQNGSTVYCSAGSDVWKCQDHTHVFDSSGSGNGSSSGNSGDSGNSGNSNPGCSNVSGWNYCNDQGSCSVGSGSGVPGPQCGHNWCCCP